MDRIRIINVLSINLCNRYRKKMKRTTILDIAQYLGLTTSTVSRALNNNTRISATTIARVKKAAKKLNYQPNALATALRSGSSKTIGVIVPALNRNFFASIIKNIEDVAKKEGYRVIITQSYDETENEIAAIETLLNASVDGILASVSKQTEDFWHFNKIIERKIPLVLFDRTSPNLDVAQVVIDDYWAAYNATEYLIKKGCKKIAHFTSSHKITIYKERYRGYLDALKDFKIPFDNKLVLESKLQLEDGKESIDKIIKYKPDGIFAASDYSLMGALQYLKLNKIKVPQEIRLFGFGNEPFTEFTTPTISTVDQKSIEMGTKSAKLIFEKIKNKTLNSETEKIILKPELIIRESSK
jgi:LacI family transcriptional regulator